MKVRLLKAKMKDGIPIEIEFENLGDSVPAWDGDGLAYEAYTSHFTCKGRFEDYSQIDKKLVDGIPDGVDNRLREDCFHLDRLGVDLATLEDENGPCPFILCPVPDDQIPPEFKKLFLLPK